jgi:glucose uptake protein
MFVPGGSDVALPMMFLLWFSWGAWPAARKQGGSSNVEFGLSYVFTQFTITTLLCFSVGMLRAQGARHFDTRLFSDVIVAEVKSKTGAVLLSSLAGSILCLGDFLMACAIDVFGVVVACPVGFGIALTAGTTLNYIIEPRADPKLLFPGLASCVMGMLCNAASHARTDHTRDPSEDSNTTNREIGLEKTNCETIPLVKQVPLRGATRKDTCYMWLLPLIGGSCCASFGPISTAAATFGKLDPYAVYFSFMLGQLLTVVPMISVYCSVQGSFETSTILQTPRGVLQAYIRSCRQRPKAFTWNCLAGLATGTGYFMFFIGTPVVSRAVGFIFGCSSVLLSIILGIFVFKEYENASCGQKALVACAAMFLVLALALMSVA